MSTEILFALKEAVKALKGGSGTKHKFGAKDIKATRLSLGLTQEEFAVKLGVSVQAVRSWEQGGKKPGALSLALLGALLAEARQVEHA